MPVNLTHLRAAVQTFDWAGVFRASLKWTKPTDTLRVELLDGQPYTLTPIAATGGMQIYVVRRADGVLPPRSLRHALETRLRRTQVEHLLVFEHAAQHAATAASSSFNNSRASPLRLMILRPKGAARSRR